MTASLYRYWAVTCKTPGCGTILLDCMGPDRPYHFPAVPPCQDFDISCGGCKTTFRYTQLDLKDVLHSVSCGQVQPSASFLNAIRILHGDKNVTSSGGINW